MNRKIKSGLQLLGAVLAAITVASFLAFNYRGVFGWTGIGVVTVPVYAIGGVCSLVLWVIGGGSFRTKKGLAVLMTLLIPAVLLLLLPLKFYV